MFFPFLVILPGLIAISVPTQHIGPAAAMTRSADGTMIAAQEEGKGLIPAKVDPINGKIMRDTSGKALLDYDLAIPNMLLHYFPTGILGLGLTALLASFMSGMAGNVTAFNTVWTYDLYQGYIHKGGTDRHYLAMGRWATVGGILLSMGAAYAATSFNNIMDTLQLVFSADPDAFLALDPADLPAQRQGGRDVDRVEGSQVQGFEQGSLSEDIHVDVHEMDRGEDLFSAALKLVVPRDAPDRPVYLDKAHLARQPIWPGEHEAEKRDRLRFGNDELYEG